MRISPLGTSPPVGFAPAGPEWSHASKPRILTMTFRNDAQFDYEGDLPNFFRPYSQIGFNPTLPKPLRRSKVMSLEHDLLEDPDLGMTELMVLDLSKLDPRDQVLEVVPQENDLLYLATERVEFFLGMGDRDPRLPPPDRFVEREALVMNIFHQSSVVIVARIEQAPMVTAFVSRCGDAVAGISWIVHHHVPAPNPNLFQRLVRYQNQEIVCCWICQTKPETLKISGFEWWA